MSKIAIVTHQLFYGAPQALRDYLLKKKTDRVIFIGLPLITQRNMTIEVYKKGKKLEEKQKYQKDLGIVSLGIEFFQTFFWFVTRQQRYDLFVGVDALNCLLGLILKKIKFTKRVIFYAIDFTPIRFENPFVNYFYHSIEALCVRNADEVWNVSPRIAEGREKFLHLSQKKYPQKVVPIGVWNEKIKKFSWGQVKKTQIVFLGHLLEKQGVQKVLEAVPLIIKKIPDFMFVILGGGEYEESLKKLTKDLDIEKYIVFNGWVKEREKIDQTLGESAAAIATYKPEEDKLRNFSYYADPTKLKDYLAAGLPIILTSISYNAKEIEKKKCGIVVKYDNQSIAEAIISLLQDQRKLKLYRENALLFAKEFDWEAIFTYAFSKK